MAKQLTIEQFEGYDDVFVNLYDDESSKQEAPVEVGSREHLLNLQLVMAKTSVNHEYARMEYDDAKDFERKEELMIYMAECRKKYDEARDELSCLNPLVLESFEQELSEQKTATMVHYHA